MAELALPSPSDPPVVSQPLPEGLPFYPTERLGSAEPAGPGAPSGAAGFGTARIRSSWEAMPLRERLVLGLMLVVAVALVGSGMATYLVINRWLVAQVDDGLTSVRNTALFPGGQYAGPTASPFAAADAIRSWQLQGAIVYAVLSNGSVQILTVNFASPDSPEPISTADVASLTSVSTDPQSRPVTIGLQQFGQSRAVAMQALLQAKGNPAPLVQVTLIAAEPLSRVDRITHTILVVELVGLVAALLAVGLVGSWFIRRSLRPLRRVADTAGQVATLPLDRGDVTIPTRVPSGHPATEVGQVALAVNAMLDHVESSLRSRQDTEERLRQFVSDAGHELRTPLAAVRGYAELVRRAGSDHPEQALTSAARIESAAARMGVLVEDLLLLASLDEGRPLDQEPVNLGELVDDAVVEARAVDTSHDWRIGPVGSAVAVTGDAARLHQVVTNLLANAAAYTPVGTTVTTSVLRIGDEVQLEVRDTGPGFPLELVPRATERFARGDASRSRATGGSGLGLAIVRAIVESHGGHLTLANDGGAVVTVHLPA
ncbi:MAG: HAMP domain-containing sensor histidine kinase [Candidatus Nanopelagicales bacterium]